MRLHFAVEETKRESGELLSQKRDGEEKREKGREDFEYGCEGEPTEKGDDGRGRRR